MAINHNYHVGMLMFFQALDGECVCFFFESIDGEYIYIYWVYHIGQLIFNGHLVFFDRPCHVLVFLPADDYT